jgi:hypothetical protein
MRIYRRFWIIFLSGLISSSSTADTIFLKDGSTIEGSILLATPAAVRIIADGNRLHDIAHNRIDSLLFEAADLVYLKSGKQVPCKILRIEDPDMAVASVGGLLVFALDTVKKYTYYTVDSLIIPFLPPTENAFYNRRFLNPSPERRRVLHVGLMTGGLWLDHSHWRSQFMDHLKGPTMTLGGYLGLTFTDFFLSGIGLEYGQVDLVNTENEQSELYLATIFARVEGRFPIEFLPGLTLFAGCDGGLMKTEGNVLLFSYRNIDFNENGYVIKPYGGFGVSAGNQLAIRIGFGYQFAGTSDIDTGVEYLEPIKLRFNGWALFAHGAYTLPF